MYATVALKAETSIQVLDQVQLQLGLRVPPHALFRCC